MDVGGVIVQLVLTSLTLEADSGPEYRHSWPVRGQFSTHVKTLFCRPRWEAFSTCLIIAHMELSVCHLLFYEWNLLHMHRWGEWSFFSCHCGQNSATRCPLLPYDYARNIPTLRYTINPITCHHIHTYSPCCHIFLVSNLDLTTLIFT